LLSCQSRYEELCNPDELQFQLVHQIEELWMKLIAYTLLDIDEILATGKYESVITPVPARAPGTKVDERAAGMLETMSRKSIRRFAKRLGNGSGRSRRIPRAAKMYQPIWNSFKTNYLDKHG